MQICILLKFKLKKKNDTILLELRAPGRSKGSAFADKLLAYFHTIDLSLSSFSYLCVLLQQDGYEATAQWEDISLRKPALFKYLKRRAAKFTTGLYSRLPDV